MIFGKHPLLSTMLCTFTYTFNLIYAKNVCITKMPLSKIVLKLTLNHTMKIEYGKPFSNLCMFMHKNFLNILP